MEYQSKLRLHRLFGVWAIPPWVLVILGVLGFIGNVQIVADIASWGERHLGGLPWGVQAVTLLAIGFLWLGLLVWRSDLTYNVAHLPSLSMRQLKEHSRRFARELRDWEFRHDEADRKEIDREIRGSVMLKTREDFDQQWHDRNSARDALRDNRAHQYKTSYEPMAKALIDEINRRRGYPEEPRMEQPILLRSGQMLSAKPLGELADYIETIVRRLPDR